MSERTVPVARPACDGCFMFELPIEGKQQVVMAFDPRSDGSVHVVTCTGSRQFQIAAEDAVALKTFLNAGCQGTLTDGADTLCRIKHGQCSRCGYSDQPGGTSEAAGRKCFSCRYHRTPQPYGEKPCMDCQWTDDGMGRWEQKETP